MANIPVERKSGAGWLPWLIGLLVIGGLIWLLAELFGDDDREVDEYAAQDTTAAMAPVAPTADTGPLRDPSGLYTYTEDGATTGAAGTTAGAGTMEGREVEFERVPVLNVVGDSAFYIGTGNDNRALVVLSRLGEDDLGAEGTDGAFDIDQGDTVSVRGIVARFQEGTPGAYALPQADRDRLRSRPLFVRVDDVGDVSSASNTIQTQN